jgi:hypothetical protein
MNDRYLFKAKRKDNGEWVQGNLIQSCDSTDGWEAIIIPVKNSNMFAKHIENDYSTMFTKPIGRGYGNLGFENWYRVDPSTICLCTGLKDKNGKLIWEYDICDRKEEYPEIVKYNNGDWTLDYSYLKGKESGYCYCNLGFYALERKYVEVIGNVFDNPELLKK